MLSKKSIKVISTILLVVMLVMALGTISFGVSADFKPDTDALDGTQANDLANTILGTIKWIGVAIAIGMLMYLGIKYITSSPEGKADLKGKLGVYILGFVLLISATVIVGVLEKTFPTDTAGEGEQKDSTSQTTEQKGN